MDSNSARQKLGLEATSANQEYHRCHSGGIPRLVDWMSEISGAVNRGGRP